LSVIVLTISCLGDIRVILEGGSLGWWVDRSLGGCGWKRIRKRWEGGMESEAQRKGKGAGRGRV